jgi:hypothetical protein
MKSLVKSVLYLRDRFYYQIEHHVWKHLIEFLSNKWSRDSSNVIQKKIRFYHLNFSEELITWKRLKNEMNHSSSMYSLNQLSFFSIISKSSFYNVSKRSPGIFLQTTIYDSTLFCSTTLDYNSKHISYGNFQWIIYNVWQIKVFTWCFVVQNEKKNDEYVNIPHIEKDIFSKSNNSSE